MNIFFLHRHPMICAQQHCDKHVVKMIVEYAQLLSTAHNVLSDYLLEGLYRPTHVNHPCAVWVRQDVSHYKWLFRLYSYLCLEYTNRYGKTHKTSSIKPLLNTIPFNIPVDNVWSDPPECMDDDCKTGDSVMSYRNYYLYKKSSILKYTNRNRPEWMK